MMQPQEATPSVDFSPHAIHDRVDPFLATDLLWMQVCCAEAWDWYLSREVMTLNNVGVFVK